MINSTIDILKGGVNEKGICLNSQIPLFQNTLLSLVLNDNLMPPWQTDNKVGPIFFPTVYKNTVEGDILAFFDNEKERFPAIVRKGDKIIFNFDPQSTIDFMQSEQYLAPHKLFYRFLPVQYHLIPGRMRRYIKRLSVLIKKNISAKGGLKFPSWPIEASVETIKYVFFSCQRLLDNRDLKLSPFWPGNKKFALILSHDIDTSAGFGNIDKFIAIEKKYDWRSSWFVVGEFFKAHKKQLTAMVEDGFEIGCHGYVHDNKLTSFTKERMREDLLRGSDMLKELGIKGFRSPSLLRSRQLFEVLEGLFLYDTSVPDTEAFLQIAHRSGCCTVFPYSILDNLLEVPITLPLDSTLMALGFKPEQIYEIWKEKIEWVRKTGGIAHITTHAESYYSGNRNMLRVYERLLDFISQVPDCWITKPADVALWWKNA